MCRQRGSTASPSALLPLEGKAGDQTNACEWTDDGASNPRFAAATAGVVPAVGGASASASGRSVARVRTCYVADDRCEVG